MEAPLVSVAVITYRQEAYIRQAMDSVLMQRFNQPWEVLVGEDRSPDATREILLDYQRAHPDRLRLFLREKNLGATRNLYEVLLSCRGRYIALLEGDDYWTDPDKLQKQVDFLEEHPDYIACTHRCAFVDQKGEPVPGKAVNEWFYEGERYTFEEFCRREMPGQTGTLVMRNLFLKPEHDYRVLYRAHPVIGDRTLFLLLAAQGDIRCMRDVMGCYRYVLQEGAPNWVSQSEHRNMLDGHVRYLCALEEYARSQLDRPVSFVGAKRKYYGQAFCKMLRRPSAKNRAVVREILRLSGQPVRFFCYGLGYALSSAPGLLRRKP